MKITTTIVALLILLIAASVQAGSHKGDREVSGAEAQQPERGQPKRAGQDQEPRKGKPKPKPKPPKGESGEKGGTEDINIGVGE